MKSSLVLILLLMVPNISYARVAGEKNLSCDDAVSSSSIYERARVAKNVDEVIVLREKTRNCAKSYEAFLFGTIYNPIVTAKLFQESLSGDYLEKLWISDKKLDQIKLLAKAHNKLP